MYWQAGRASARIKRDVREREISVAMNLQPLRTRFEPALQRVFHLYWRFARGMTLGVRAVVLDGDNRVFLVKHSYVAGWHLPGGDVAVYLVRDFRQDRLPEPNREIVACGFFEASALPAETTEGTRLRISEVLEGKAPISTWR